MDQSSPAAAANIRYQEAHLSDSRVPNVIATIAICLPCAIGAVILRFVSRRLGRVPIKADDWWIVLGLVGHLLAVNSIRRGQQSLILPQALYNKFRCVRDVYHAFRPRSPCCTPEGACALREGILHDRFDRVRTRINAVTGSCCQRGVVQPCDCLGQNLDSSPISSHFRRQGSQPYFQSLSLGDRTLYASL